MTGNQPDDVADLRRGPLRVKAVRADLGAAGRRPSATGAISTLAHSHPASSMNKQPRVPTLSGVGVSIRNSHQLARPDTTGPHWADVEMDLPERLEDDEYQISNSEVSTRREAV